MAHLNVMVSDESFAALRRYAAHRQVSGAALVQEYIDYLISGGQPVVPLPGGGPTPDQRAMIAQHGGSFEWLEAEPELYSSSDGEAV